MSESLQSILAGRSPAQPPEIKIIQQFVVEKFEITPTVTVTNQQIIIGVTGASLAGALRPSLHILQDLCQTKKRLVLRIL